MKEELNLPFGIDFVVESDLVPLGFKKFPSTRGYSINCPFCEKKGYTPDTKHRYGIDVYKNVGHCMRCDTGNGILSLHQQLSNKPISMQEAKTDLLNMWAGLPSDVKIEMKNFTVESIKKKEKLLYPADLEIRDTVYRKFLSQLTLSDKHKADLLKRGLTEDEVVKGLYKSVPVVGLETFVKKSLPYEVRDYLRRHPKAGIPGFYGIRSDNPKMVRLDNGYFVPVITRERKISGLQIRYDELPDDASKDKKEHWAKYKWFVSNYKNIPDGCTASGIENVHYAGHFVKFPKNIMLTEGELKADVAHALSSRISNKEVVPYLAIVGVNNTDSLAEELLYLKDGGLEKVTMCFDMDYLTKPQVKKAMDKIVTIITSCGLEVSRMKWPKEYKGIDDFLLEVYKRK